MKAHFGSFSFVTGLISFILMRYFVAKSALTLSWLLVVLAIGGLSMLTGALGMRKRADKDGYLLRRKWAGIGLALGTLSVGLATYALYLAYVKT